MKKKIHMLLAVLLCLSLLTGCGRQAKAEARPASDVQEESGGQTLYRTRFFELDDSGLTAALSNGTLVDGALYFSSAAVIADETPAGVTPEWPEQYWVYGAVLCRLTPDGALSKVPYVSPCPAEAGSGVLFEQLCAGEDGTLWVLEYRYHRELGEEETLRESYALVHIRTDGSVLSELALEELRSHPEAADSGDDSYGFWIDGMAADGAGRLCLALSEYSFGGAHAGQAYQIVVLDAETGTVVKRLDMDSSPEQIAPLTKGSIAVLSYENGSEQIGALKLDSGDFTAQASVDGYPDELTLGGDGRLYYSEGDSLYRFDLESGEAERLLRWIDCDVSHSNGESVCVLSDGTVLTVHAETRGSTTKNSLISLSPSAEETTAEKKVLRVAVTNLDPYTAQMVSRFNRGSSEYRIEVTDYSEFNDYSSGNEEDWNAGITRLQTEIIAGDGPDILDISLLSADRLGAKGQLVDLYPYLDADPELSRSDLLEPVLAAFEENGKLYQSVSNFYLLTTLGLSEYVGDSMGWNVPQLQAALARLQADEPHATIFDPFITRNDVLNFLLYLELGNFADWESGECRFDSPGFIRMLEFLDSFPEYFDWAGELDMDEDARLLSGQQLIKLCTLTDFQSVQSCTAGLGAAPYTFVGYPTESGVGSMFAQFGSAFAISSSCADKEAAWQFVRLFFLPAYQELLSGELFPTNRAVYERMKAEQMTPQYRRNPDGSFILDEEGRRIETDAGLAMVNGAYIRLHTVTAEEAALTEELIASTTHVLRLDDSLKEIITGAAAYFAGQKSAEETARLIQSRASLYISEQG